MATKKIEESKLRTLFIVPREKFQVSLQRRLDKVQDLANRDIQTQDQLDESSNEFYKWESINEEILKQSFNRPDNEYYYQYSRLNSSSGLFDYLDGVDTQTTSYKIYKLKQNIKNSIEHLELLIEKADLIQEDKSIKLVSTSVVETQPLFNVGFLVHGHNEKIKFEVARFVENELKKKVIILHEQPNRGNTIIEKFERYSEVDFAISLWTADDRGKSLTEEEFKLRARQNVVFETGFFIGKLGRSKVIVLYEDGVELPSDYSGVIFISLSGNWMYNLTKEILAIYQN